MTEGERVVDKQAATTDTLLDPSVAGNIIEEIVPAMADRLNSPASRCHLGVTRQG